MARKTLQTLMKHIATLGPIGYLPAAPGTFGSLVGALLFVAVKPSAPLTLLILFTTLIIGTMASHQAEQLLKEKDSGHIVIDEFAGYAVSVLFLPADMFYYLAAFLLFRFFDILKPPPVRNIERLLPGGLGIMADDVLAGVYTNAALQIWKLLTGN